MLLGTFVKYKTEMSSSTNTLWNLSSSESRTIQKDLCCFYSAVVETDLDEIETKSSNSIIAYSVILYKL